LIEGINKLRERERVMQITLSFHAVIHRPAVELISLYAYRAKPQLNAFTRALQ
jgi:hypothetical protein